LLDGGHDVGLAGIVVTHDGRTVTECQIDLLAGAEITDRDAGEVVHGASLLM